MQKIFEFFIPAEEGNSSCRNVQHMNYQVVYKMYNEIYNYLVKISKQKSKYLSEIKQKINN